eukprot:gene10885-14608_t
MRINFMGLYALLLSNKKILPKLYNSAHISTNIYSNVLNYDALFSRNSSQVNIDFEGENQAAKTAYYTDDVKQRPTNINTFNGSNIVNLPYGNDKQLLQLICKFLYNGSTPLYQWSETNHKLIIFVGSQMRFEQLIYTRKNEQLTNSIKRNYESLAASKLLNHLKSSSKYGYAIQFFLSNKLNKYNNPRLLDRQSIISIASTKQVVILIDIENVPDFRKYFYITNKGDIMLSSPLPPSLVDAPSLLTSSYEFVGITTDKAIFDTNYDKGSYDDDNILVLTYAHSLSTQSVWANRITKDNRKDAADVLIIFDLGALEYCTAGTALKRIILVTQDKFAQSVQACFESIGIQIGNTNNDNNNDNKIVKARSSLSFQWLSTCNE